jgi:hypothetical protein
MIDCLADIILEQVRAEVEEFIPNIIGLVKRKYEKV